MLGRFVNRGQRLIKVGDSWFFAKAIEVACKNNLKIGKAG